jgi:hypothetical protein
MSALPKQITVSERGCARCNKGATPPRNSPESARSK